MKYLSLFFIVLGLASCSSISFEKSADRSPSSLSQKYANCELLSADDHGRYFHIYVDGEAYPHGASYRPHEAEKMLTRFGQTKTCHN